MTWDFLHRWWMPLAWLTATSAVSVPVAWYFQRAMTLRTGVEAGLPYGDGWAMRDDVLGSIVVYGLGLGAAVWFMDGNGSTRWAAFWAGGLALARIIAPVVLTSLSSVTIGGQAYVDWHTLRWLMWFQDVQFCLLCVMVWIAFSRFVGEASPILGRAHAGHLAEA